MRLRQVSDAQVALWELAAAGLLALAAGILLPGEVMKRVDDALIASLSIVLAAALPGVALTAAASRPRAETPLEARRFGDALAGQVRFWFSFLWTGGGAVAALILGKAFDWSLAAPPRPQWMPDWTPAGGAWLVFAAVLLMGLVTIRTRHLVGAIQSIIQVGTDVQIQEARDQERRFQAEVSSELRALKVDPERGANLGDRQRH